MNLFLRPENRSVLQKDEVYENATIHTPELDCFILTFFEFFIKTCAQKFRKLFNFLRNFFELCFETLLNVDFECKQT